MLRQILLCTWLIWEHHRTAALSLDGSKLPGIWKLTLSEAGGNIAGQPATKKLPLLPDTETGDVLLRIQVNGRFRQCNEGYVEGAWLQGQWALDDDACCWKLAMDRQYYGPPHDAALVLSLHRPNDDNDDATCWHGEWCVGKFVYPKSHHAFFEGNLLANPLVVHRVQLQQVVRDWTATPPSIGAAAPPPPTLDGIATTASSTNTTAALLTIVDLADKHFYMTTVPVGQQQQQHDRRAAARRSTMMGPRAKHAAAADIPVPLQAVPIKFYGNGTFCIRQSHKILRGRYRIENNDLSFEVSLFGAGGSAPGSVYSEGPGLSHEDRRNYAGMLERFDNKLWLNDGVVTVGTDLGSDARPEPVGTFLLRQVSNVGSDAPVASMKDGDDALPAFQ